MSTTLAAKRPTPDPSLAVADRPCDGRIAWRPASHTAARSTALAGGLRASQAHYLMLEARLKELEVEGRFVHQARMRLASSLSRVLFEMSRQPLGSRETEALQARIDSMSHLDREYALHLEAVHARYEEVQREIDNVKSAIEGNVSKSFRLLGLSRAGNGPTRPGPPPGCS